MASKRKITGRIVYATRLEDSQIYWTCPSRGCKHIHYFPFIFQQSSGATPLYEKECEICGKSYIATQVSVQGSTALLIASNKEEPTDDPSISK